MKPRVNDDGSTDRSVSPGLTAGGGLKRPAAADEDVGDRTFPPASPPGAD